MIATEVVEDGTIAIPMGASQAAGTYNGMQRAAGHTPIHSLHEEALADEEGEGHSHGGTRSLRPQLPTWPDQVLICK